jgi:ABC-2 type transport system ATP-binding protein
VIALATVGLTRRNGQVVALDAVDLVVPTGCVFGLVGPNGSGKTTLLETAAGLRCPTEGTVQLGGEVAYCPDVAEFEPWLTALEVLEVGAAITGHRTTGEQARTVLARVGLAEAANRRVGGFSRGMTTRLNIAAGLIGAPRIILLDEPAAALDPAGRVEVLQLVSSLAPEATVLVSSHDLTDIEAICDRVGILAVGRLLYSGPLDRLLAGAGAPRWRLVVRPPSSPTVAALRAAPWSSTVDEVGEDEVEFSSSDPAVVEANLANLLASSDTRIVSVTPVRPTFEQVFLALTTVAHDTPVMTP